MIQNLLIYVVQTDTAGVDHVWEVAYQENVPNPFIDPGYLQEKRRDEFIQAIRRVNFRKL